MQSPHILCGLAWNTWCTVKTSDGIAVETSLMGDESSPSAVSRDDGNVILISVSSVSPGVSGVILLLLCMMVVVSIEVGSDSSLRSGVVVKFECKTCLEGE